MSGAGNKQSSVNGDAATIASLGMASGGALGGLAEKITKGGRMSETQIKRWLLGVGAALAAAFRGMALGRLDAESVAPPPPAGRHAALGAMAEETPAPRRS